jgi:hypothetical protein
MEQRIGLVTAYGYAKSKGYTGTEAEFAQAMLDLAEEAEELANISATATTLDANQNATASYNEGEIEIGVPKGTTFTPSVSSEGVLSWSNDGGKTNPQSVDIASAVGNVFVEEVTGTDVTINGVANHRYICGELTSLTIVAPSKGIIDIIFESGSTATIVTLPTGVKMPPWYSIEPNTTYEISITDGTYGAVALWT